MYREGLHGIQTSYAANVLVTELATLLYVQLVVHIGQQELLQYTQAGVSTA